MPLIIFKKKRIAQIIESLFTANNYDLYNDKTVLAVKGGQGSLLETTNTSFIDSSSNQRTFVKYGNVHQGSFSPFADIGGSAYFDGTGDYLTFSNNSNLTVGTGDFTIEFWINSPTVQNDKFILGFRNASGTFHITTGGYSGTLSGSLRWASNNTCSTSVITDGKWHHCAITRQTGIVKLWIDGKLENSVSDTTNSGTTSGTFIIGAQDWPASFGASGYFAGFLSNLRIVKGTAVYTSNFSVPTAPLTDIPGTGLLMKFENGGIVDSKRNYNLDCIGNTALTTTDKKYVASVYFDGSGDYMSAGQKDTWAFLHNNTTPYTIECWFNTSLANAAQGLITTDSASAQVGMSLSITATNELRAEMYRGSSGSFLTWGGTGTPTISLNEWHHAAFVWAGSGLGYLFLDGQLIDSTYTLSGTWPAYSTASPQYPLTIGCAMAVSQSGPYNYFKGYIDDLRISKSARYTTSFTPRATEIATVTNTEFDPYWEKVVLQMPMDGADNSATFTELTGKTVLRSGSAVTSTVNKKFGSTSLSVTPGNYVYIPPSSDFNVGNVYTIECWIYCTSGPNAYGKYSSLLGRRTSGDTNSWYIHVCHDVSIGAAGPSFEMRGASNQVLVTVSSTNPVYQTPLNQWVHIAVTSDGNTIRVFQNGNLVASAAYSGNLTYSDSQNLAIGGLPAYGEWFNGYIDDVRITKGVARYTKNFAVPSKALPVSDFVYSSPNNMYDPYWTQTALSMNMDTLVDAKGSSISNTGLQLNTSVKKFGSASAEFFNGGALINTASVFNFGLADYTIEFWLNPVGMPSATGNWLFISSPAGGIAFGYLNASNFGLATNGGSWILSTTTLPQANQWNHIVLSRTDGVAKLFINGTLVASGAETINWPAAATWIGHPSQSYCMPGYIDDLRITKGKARYIRNFTVPALPNPTTGPTF